MVQTSRWPVSRLPISNIQPFTYRDGETYLSLLNRLAEYITTQLHPNLRQTVEEMVEEMEHILADQHGKYVEGVQDFQRIHDAFMEDVNSALMALNDGAVSDLVEDPGSSVGRVIRELTETAVVESQGGQRVVANHPKFGEPYTKQSVINALDYAESLGKWTVVYFPRGVYELEDGLSLDRYSVQIQGDGAGLSFEPGKQTIQYDGEPGGTVFRASQQDGPVLDYRGWIPPGSFQGKASHGNFYVVGSHKPDTSKYNSGIAFDSISSCHFHDIAIRGTGGPGMIGMESQGDAVYLNNFSRIVVDTPVGCKENNVPYFEFNEANGNNFHSLAIRSRDNQGVGDCGVGGAIRVVSNNRFSSRRNVWDSTWIEFIHVPTDGTIFHVEASLQEFRSTIFWDQYKEPGATNTSHYRFIAPQTQDHGSNIVTGNIPGAPRDNTPNSANIDYGIDIRQRGVFVSGTKDHYEHHVILREGAQDCFIMLGGGFPGNVGYGVVDDSGNETNTILDAGAGVYHFSKSSAITRSIDFRVGGTPQETRVLRQNLSGFHTLVHTPSTILHYVLTGDGGVHSAQPGKHPGEMKTMIIEQDDIGGHRFWFNRTEGTPIDFQDGTPPPINTGPGETTVIQLLWTGTRWSHIR